MNRLFSDLKDKSNNFSRDTLNKELRKNIRSYTLSSNQFEKLKKSLISYRRLKMKKYYENKINKNSKNIMQRLRGRQILREIRFHNYENKRNAVVNYLFSKPQYEYVNSLNELRNFGLLGGVSEFGNIRREVLKMRRNKRKRNNNQV